MVFGELLGRTKTPLLQLNTVFLKLRQMGVSLLNLLSLSPVEFSIGEKTEFTLSVLDSKVRGLRKISPELQFKLYIWGLAQMINEVLLLL